MYGQPHGPSMPPYGPANAGAGTKPPKPGPTGPMMIVGGAVLAVVEFVAFVATLELMSATGAGSTWVYFGRMVILDLLPVVYLAIFGRGAAGKALGAGLALVALFTDVVIYAVLEFVDLPNTAATAVNFVGGLAVGILLVLAWGFARRSGWWWLVSVPAFVVLWVVYYFGVLDQFDVVDRPTRYLRHVVYVVMLNVLPVMVGWGAEVLTRSSNPPRTGMPAVPAAGGPVIPQRTVGAAPAPQGHWQWHPGPPPAPQSQDPQQGHPPRWDQSVTSMRVLPRVLGLT